LKFDNNSDVSNLPLLRISRQIYVRITLLRFFVWTNTI